MKHFLKDTSLPAPHICRSPAISPAETPRYLWLRCLLLLWPSWLSLFFVGCSSFCCSGLLSSVSCPSACTYAFITEATISPSSNACVDSLFIAVFLLYSKLSNSQLQVFMFLLFSSSCCKLCSCRLRLLLEACSPLFCAASSGFNSCQSACAASSCLFVWFLLVASSYTTFYEDHLTIIYCALSVHVSICFAVHCSALPVSDSFGLEKPVNCQCYDTLSVLHR